MEIAMVASVDIANRALILAGSEVLLPALTQDSMEAKTLNLVYQPLIDYCHTLTNWNFARKTVALTVSKSLPAPPLPSWGASTMPSPPWQFEYLLPTDFIKAQYVTNQANVNNPARYDGEPQRGQVVMINTGTPQLVVLTNQTLALLVYTARILDPTQWSPYFTQLAVEVLAAEIALSISKSLELRAHLRQVSQETIAFAIMANKAEGLITDDTTPEWIDARGIGYPFNQGDPRLGVRTPLAFMREPQRNDRGR